MPDLSRSVNERSGSDGTRSTPDVPIAMIASDVVFTSAPCPVDGIVVEDLRQAGLRVLDEHIKAYSAITSGQRVYLKVRGRLGQGMSSYVYHVYDLHSDQQFALKMIPEKGSRLDVARADIEVLKRYDHKNILKCHDSFLYKKKHTHFFCIQLDLCQRGSLREYIERKKKKKEKIFLDPICNFLFQIASGLAYIHERDAIHGNLCLDSVLVSAKCEVKLCHFGLPEASRSPAASRTITGGLRAYAPPEWATSGMVNRPLGALECPLPSYDIWGLGCILAELCTMTFLTDRVGPTGSLALDEAAHRRLLADMGLVYEGAFLPTVSNMLHFDPDERTEAVDVMRTFKPMDDKFKVLWTKFLQKASRSRFSGQS